MNARETWTGKRQLGMVADVTICGGGASAVLLAAALSRLTPDLAVAVIDSGLAPGRGLAYGVAARRHVLNTRVDRMSIWPDEPYDFVRWLNTHRARPEQSWLASDFAWRIDYGDYLTGELSRLERVAIVDGRAVGAMRAPGGWRVAIDNGTIAETAFLVLATGNRPPVPILATDATISTKIVNDPWDPIAMTAVPRDAPVAILGAGLTAVDIALELIDSGRTAPLTMISRRGLLPGHHRSPPTVEPWLKQPYPARLAQLVSLVRAKLAEAGGDVVARHSVIDAIRPVVPSLWEFAAPSERARFVRHIRPYWDMERHRIAPFVGDRLNKARSAGLIETRRGRLAGIARADAGVRLEFTSPGGRWTRDFGAVVNCTGPDYGPRAAAQDPLLKSLFDAGEIRPDVMSLGIDIDDSSKAQAERGAPSGRLYAMGGLTRGKFWEITAVPELRTQARRIALDIRADIHAGSRRGRTNAEAGASG